MKEERVIHPLAPIVDEECEILILGSLPSVKSREDHFYYANKQNRFWKVISAIYHQELPTNKDKTEILLKHHIALWDSIHSCMIKGSSDASIRDVVPNDIPQLIHNTHIHTIICNGKTSEKYYKKYLEDKTHIAPITLPSTSSANASYSLEKLIELYMNALKQA